MANNLNKENFWNLMMEKYPKATQMFCDWVDEYKKETGMDEWIDRRKGHVLQTVPSIKFHDLPIEMQVGITSRFFYEKDIDGLDTDNYAKDVAFMLSILNGDHNEKH